MRHAETEEHAATGRDEDRSLTERGLTQATAVARGLAALEPGIALVLTSPYLRARQTAQPAAEALGLSGARSTRALEPGSNPEAVLSALEELEEESVLLVGHAPLLGLLLGRLVAPGPDADIPLSKAGVACVSLRRGARGGRLEAFLPLKVSERLSK